MVCCGMELKRMGKLGVSARKRKALNVNVKSVTMIGKGRQNLTCIIYCVQLIVEHFSERMFYLWGVFLDLDKYIFLWQMCFICGVVLEWSCTQKNMVLFKMKKENIMK